MMEHPKDKYIKMITTFRICDLETLLETQGLSKSGRKLELINRAINVLNVNPPWSPNYQPYITIIDVMYKTLANANLNDGELIQVQNFDQGGPYQPPNMTSQLNFEQSPRPVQPGPLQCIDQPRFVQCKAETSSMTPVPQNQNQIMRPLTDTSNPRQETKYIHTLPATVILKNLPFYEITKNLGSLTILTGVENSTLPYEGENTFYCISICTLNQLFIIGLTMFFHSFVSDMREAFFQISIPIEDIKYLLRQRDMTEDSVEYFYQVLIRIYRLEQGAIELSDCLPPFLNIVVNGEPCPLPPINHSSHLEVRVPKPIVCTDYIKLNRSLSNLIAVNWLQNEETTYVIGFHIAKAFDSKILIDKVICKNPIALEETKKTIIKQLANIDPDLATTSTRYSLICPLSKQRMEFPARSSKCVHLQCFDLRCFIKMNEVSSKWKCPTCFQPCLYDDVQIENYFLSILTDPNLPKDCEEVEVLPDGSWKAYNKLEETNIAEEGQSKKIKLIDSVIVIDDDSDGGELSPKPETSSVANDNLKLIVIDLTVSDGDDSPSTNNEPEPRQVDTIQNCKTQEYTEQ